MTPQILAYLLHSLPPILHIIYPNSILSCSEGSRGLSVPLRVNGIFTVATISPSSWPRQRPDRYTIRAGRNLPDKEFRYLRTVIVTAAVYRGFNSMLLLRWHLLLTFRHRAGVRPYTSSFNFAKPCVFDKQSPGPFLCALSSLSRDPLSRSYGVNLPSSLAMNHSSTFGFSPRLPVSVYGTGHYNLKLSGFSWELVYDNYPLSRRIKVLSGSTFSTDLPIKNISTPFNVLFRQYACLSLLCHHIAVIMSIGILTNCPSTSPFGYILGPD